MGAIRATLELLSCLPRQNQGRVRAGCPRQQRPLRYDSTAMRIYSHLRRQPKGLIVGLSFLLAFLIGFVDALTGREISFSIFYLLPVMLMACVCRRPQRVAISLLCGVSWLVAELWSGFAYSEAWIPYWNALLRFGIFAIASELSAQVVERNAALEIEIGERKEAEGKLKDLNQRLEEKVAERTATVERRSLELSQSEVALRKQTAILQSVLNNMGDGVVVVDATGSILLCNPEAERLLKMNRASASFHDWLQKQGKHLPGRDAEPPETESTLLRAIRGDAIDGAEMFVQTNRLAEGVWVRATSRPLVDDSGKFHGAVMVFNDVTARNALEKQIAEVSDREQRRIGQDLHDGVCQHLVSTSFACNLLAETLTEKGLSEAEQATEISRLIREAILQARNLARVLYPVELTTDGLVPALEYLAHNVRSAAGIPCRCDCDATIRLADEVAETNFFRIAQEAVNNAVKHSQATEIAVELCAFNDWITLNVQDDGVGFQRVAGRKGMGLHIMESRARAIGASFEVRRRLTGGTVVSCSLRNADFGT